MYINKNHNIQKKTKLKTTLLKLSLLSLCLSTSSAFAQNTVSCEGNAHSDITKKTAHLTDNNDGTISDPKTGLMWKKCSEGQTWSSTGGGCGADTDATVYNWKDALARATEVNGGAGGENLSKTDWRVPNRNELLSIAELSCDDPAINATVFPATPSSFFWSSSPYAPNSANAWNVNFYNGNGIANHRSVGKYVRLVRSGQ